MFGRPNRLPASQPRFVPRPLAGEAAPRVRGLAGPEPGRALRARWLDDLGAADFALVAFIVLAIALGGGGSPSPLPEMLLEWAALTVLAGVALLDRRNAPWPRQALGFAMALLALPTLQLVPLPPAIWHALPGREIEVAALELVQAGQRWMPWTLSPPRTLASLLALIVPVTTAVTTAFASRRGRTFALVAIAGMALLSAAIGAAQLAGGPHSALRFYAASHVEDLTGFQANRNAEADVLLIGLIALAALAYANSSRLRHGGAVAWAVVAVLRGGAVLLTASRAGIALLVVATAVAALGIGLRPSAQAWRARMSPPARLGLGSAALATVAGVAWAVASNPVLARIGQRFAGGSEPRPEIWRDTVFAIGQYWPWGSGIGTFVPVFVAAERLEAVNSSFPNRAHNDFLELTLEAGVPGLALLAILAGSLVWCWVIRWRSGPTPIERAELYFSAATLVLIGLHSSVDYPLRSMALAALAGVASGFILAPARYRGGAASSGRVETKQP